ncbi:MAG TPA: hypothetical protein VE944_32910 [Nostoc sp.]|uniref:hypothetical protein n=1 Tax=Nostoc sp. TaxID=1180 RepID=UPI002D54D196|nr:hypothetical protein [Nostoc sp.]HYX19070.1 hypothetical protein [Nostoc sp.]
MSYCQIGEIATVNYTFGDGRKEKFISNTSPINVNLISQTLNTYNYYDPNSQSNRTAQGTSYITKQNLSCQQGQTDIDIFNGNSLVTNSCFLAGSLTIIPPNQECTLIVKDVNNLQLFTVSGKCPVNFTVTCGDGCPEGFCKCVIPEYPGYCCLDCNSTAASIRTITNELRGKNG